MYTQVETYRDNCIYAVEISTYRWCMRLLAQSKITAMLSIGSYDSPLLQMSSFLVVCEGWRRPDRPTLHRLIILTPVPSSANAFLSLTVCLLSWLYIP